MFNVLLVYKTKKYLNYFLDLGKHGGTEFPLIIEQNCLTVLGMDNGFTKVALPFSVN
jgi:hypothetical protein